VTDYGVLARSIPAKPQLWQIEIDAVMESAARDPRFYKIVASVAPKE
jgi:hypothetical protein